jgi:hypothetical protein
MSQLIFPDPELSHQNTAEASYGVFPYGAGLRFEIPLQDSAQYLAELVHEIQKHPKNLTAHIQRIFCCYRENLPGPLYAALVDFLIVLNKQGEAISRRMISGALSKLPRRQGALLKAALKGKIEDITLLEGNGYSVFSRGLSGTVNLIEKLDEQKSNDHDPLKLAQDAVEYCQLEEAMLILERALEEQPQAPEFHKFLLELYKSTQNRNRFETVFARLRHLGIFMTDSHLQQEWEQLKDYFEQKTHE